MQFFGRPAYTPVAPAQISLKTGAPIVPVFVVRAGSGFRVVTRAPILPEAVKGSEHPVEALTQLCARTVEDVIRSYPCQWIWNHERWRTTPEKLEQRKERELDRAAQARAASRSALARKGGSGSVAQPSTAFDL